jgi:hypothetical protein
MFLTGCNVYDEGNRYYLTEKLSPKKIAQVELLYSKPKKEFIIIADLQGKRHTISSIRKRAAEIGADAVIIIKTGGTINFGDTKWAGTDTGETHLSGVAIKYK